MSSDKTPRRDFLGQIAASAIVLAGSACAAPASVAHAATTMPGPNTQQTAWDDSWFSRLTAKHKAVFDSPDFEEGVAVSQAAGYIKAMRDALGAGPNDVQTVVVVRHHAVPMAFNDAMWSKYKIGEERQVKDSTGKWATANPYIGSANASGRSGDPNRPQSNLTWLLAHDNFVLACDLATHGFAGTMAQKTKGDAKAIYDELKANLVPGVILQPTGVYAVHRAQEAGCTYIKSS